MLRSITYLSMVLPSSQSYPKKSGSIFNAFFSTKLFLYNSSFSPPLKRHTFMQERTCFNDNAKIQDHTSNSAFYHNYHASPNFSSPSDATIKNLETEANKNGGPECPQESDKKELPKEDNQDAGNNNKSEGNNEKKESKFLGSIISFALGLSISYVWDKYKDKIIPIKPHIPMDESFPENYIHRASKEDLYYLSNVTRENKLHIIEIIGDADSGKSTLALEYATYYQKELKKTKKKLLTVQSFDCTSGTNDFIRQLEQFASKLEVLASTPDELISCIVDKLADRPHFLLIFNGINSIYLQEDSKKSDEKESSQHYEVFMIKKLFNNGFGNRGLIICTTEKSCFRPHESKHILMSERTFDFNLKNSLFQDDLNQIKTVKGVERNNFLLVQQVKSMLNYSLEEGRDLKNMTTFLTTNDGKNFASNFYKHTIDLLINENDDYSKLFGFIILFDNKCISKKSLDRLSKTIPNLDHMLDKLKKLHLIQIKKFDEIIFSSGLKKAIKKMDLENPSNPLSRKGAQLLCEVYTMDNRYNGDLIVHSSLIENISNIKEKIEPLSESLPLLNFYLCVANNFIQKNQFKAAKKFMEYIEKQDEGHFSSIKKLLLEKKDPKSLTDKDKKFARLYANYCHYIGKIHFAEGCFEKANENFSEAVSLIQLYSDFPEKELDFLIFKRVIGWVLIRESKYKDAIELYKHLIKLTKTGDFNINYCNLQLMKTYSAMFIHLSNDNKIGDAKNSNKVENPKPNDKSENSDPYANAINYMLLYKQETPSHARSGAFLNACGELFLNDPIEAKKSFKDAIATTIDQVGQDAILADAFYNLVKLDVALDPTNIELETNLEKSLIYTQKMIKQGALIYKKNLKYLEEVRTLENAIQFSMNPSF